MAVAASLIAGVATALVIEQPVDPAALSPLPFAAERTDLTLDDAARVDAVTEPTVDFTKAERFERMAGGAATSTARVDGNAFSHPSANLSLQDRQDFFVGNGLFKKLWVSSPSSTAASDGLGPLFNARGCQRCHLKDGRGHPPASAHDTNISMLMRLSIPPATEADAAALANLTALRIAEPNYGGQLQDFAVPGLAAEGRFSIAWAEDEVALAGGEVAQLRRPIVSLHDLASGPFAPGTMRSLRIANPMIGLGLLEAIHPADILAAADVDDHDGDGISGKPSIVRDPTTGELALGRFGWKASTPSIAVQSAEAFAGDIGISTLLLTDAHGDCTIAQIDCRAMPTGVQPRLGTVEAPDPVLDLVAFYSRNLAVPARRAVSDPQVLAGKAHFYASGCAACHRPKFVTRRDALHPAQSFQLIWPYTDMLLHDMGEGLADSRPVGTASGREWRTAPLWGIGLTETVNGHMQLLHDGRARGVLEAILWHGGEAAAARDRVVQMSPQDRAALVRFVRSL